MFVNDPEQARTMAACFIGTETADTDAVSLTKTTAPLG
jgi:hypothetical protein